ncbi:MAG: hypothetical protein L0Z50_42200 [Verrucomicrobiales bacterium]|nr:hypothetical protein [Verrucomicrobiales bacterium]
MPTKLNEISEGLHSAKGGSEFVFGPFQSMFLLFGKILTGAVVCSVALRRLLASAALQ